MTAKQKRQQHQALASLGDTIRVQGKARTTEKAYCRELSRYIEFLCSPKCPDGTPEEKLEHYLTAEANRGVSASTQNSTFAAITFYYRYVLKKPLEGVDALRAKPGKHVRQAPSVEDVRRFLMTIEDTGQYPTRLLAYLLYGCGTRLGETLAIRRKDMDIKARKLTIIAGKNKKDRIVNIPPSLVPQLKNQLDLSKVLHAKATMMGVPTKLPNLLRKKYPRYEFSPGWFWLFPMSKPCRDIEEDENGVRRRVWWHCLDGVVQEAFRTASDRAELENNITPHRLRHAWATHAYDEGACARDLQEVLGHADIRTTMGYIRPDPDRVVSPLESLNLKSA
jgi:site-specific recombinase XerD